MKVHKVTLTIIDFGGLGQQSVIDALENARYPNRCISPSVASIQTADCGEWSDDHPLNRKSTSVAELERLFAGAQQ